MNKESLQKSINDLGEALIDGLDDDGELFSVHFVAISSCGVQMGKVSDGGIKKRVAAIAHEIIEGCLKPQMYALGNLSDFIRSMVGVRGKVQVGEISDETLEELRAAMDAEVKRLVLRDSDAKDKEIDTH